MKCELCGKQAKFGHSVSHSKQYTARRWLPNIHRTTIIVEGKKRKINICTRCLRTQYKAGR
ncbi:MAG: 50S ribosomal protein L28 [Dehalococcoidia bacterium]